MIKAMCCLILAFGSYIGVVFAQAGASTGPISLYSYGARNLIIGEAIKVCTDYSKATEAAIKVWHDGLS